MRQRQLELDGRDVVERRVPMLAIVDHLDVIEDGVGEFEASKGN